MRKVGGRIKAALSPCGRNVENVVEPLATETVGVVFTPASKPEMQLLHVFECNLVKQVVVGFAAGIESIRLVARLNHGRLL